MYGFVYECQMFMLDMLDNLPRLRLSDDHLKAIIWVMKECGTPNVPSFYALRKMQAKLLFETSTWSEIVTRAVGLKPKHHTSVLNNQFYMNHPNDLIRLDFANPLVRKFIHVYPEVTSTISEFWQAAKYVAEIERDELSPMWADWEKTPHHHFYIRELAQCKNRDYVLPVKWIVSKDAIHADAYAVTREPSGTFTVEDHTLVRILATDLQYNFLDIQMQARIIFSTPARPAIAPYSPHPIRNTAKGRPVFVLRVMPWDDVSGNRSKQYNAHMNMYLANINIPHKLLAQEYFVRFCATSPHASSLEQFDALSADCKGDNWTAAYDCQLKEEILFRIRAHLLPVDNPQQAESASTAGSSSTFWCRVDDSGGSASHRETDQGYHALYSPGKARTPKETIERITKQIKTACLGVESAVEALQTETGVKDKIATHWIGLLIEKAREVQKERVYNHATRDPRLNDKNIKGEPREKKSKTNYKYVWHETTKAWSDAQGELFAARLQSASFDGLNMLPLRASYLVQYKNSLIGKHFKGLQQLAIFQLDGTLCSPAVFELWKANGVLGALLWYPEIRNMDQYLADLQLAIDNVLDRWAIVEPTRIMVKYKLHVLPHIPEAVRRFGPSILFATEIFECWNAVFRLCSVLSNHQAPSLDISTTLADMERFKHQVSGGWWKPEKADEWIQAGPRIRSFLTGNKQLQRRLGWTPPNLLKPGNFQILSEKKLKLGSWKTSLGSHWKAGMIEPLLAANWIDCKYAIACSEDVCFVNSWIFFGDGTIAGRIAKILAPENSVLESSAVVVEHFDVSDSNDARLDMPLLIRTAENSVVKPKHDCSHFSCPLVDATGPNQERQTSKITQKKRIHSDDSRFHINLHALHNAHLIRETLPRHLTKPKPCFTDREIKHNEFAATLRETGPEKRAETQARAQATKLRNKQAKEDKASAAKERAR
ncbi:hypothetical protein K438DRAFT_1910535 [Mycena galopus ATCC 62051]|nr:hypothetical protein K438DRAFT_1910535 [Mycena galopus ATCC 62051]